MRLSLRMALMLNVLFVSDIYGAEPSGPQSKPGTIRMAWINFDQLVAACDEGKKAFSELQKFFDEKTKQRETLGKEIDALRNQLTVQQNKLTPEARGEIQDQITAKEANLQRFQQDTQRQLNSHRARIGRTIQKKAKPVIEKFAKERGLNVVVYLDTVDVWVDKAFLITDEAVKAYNAAYPGSPGPAPKP